MSIVEVKLNQEGEVFFDYGSKYDMKNRSPNFSVKSTQLYDDGSMSDKIAGDLIYSNTFLFQDFEKRVIPFAIRIGENYYHANGFSYFGYGPTFTFALSSINSDIDIENALSILKNKFGNYYHIDEDNEYRFFVYFIDGAYTVDHVENEGQAYEAAKAYGKFQKYLSDYDTNKCHITIKDFHNLSNRIMLLENAIKLNPQNRITHNDTKINNIMLNEKTNYISGDVYYKIDYDLHNLSRAKNQFELLASIEKQSYEMEKIVEKYSYKDKTILAEETI